MFIKKTVGALLLASPAYVLLSCSSADDSNLNDDTGGGGNDTANCLANGTASNIGSNHGHSLTVSKSDISAGAEKTYSITGTSAHPHSVTVTAANFTNLKNNQSITVTSTVNSGHSHSVTVSCA